TVAIAAAAAAIVLAIWASSLSSSLDTKNAALAVLSNQGSRRLPLGTASQVVVAPNGHAVVVSGLSRAPSGKTYELWVLDGKSVNPAGVFVQGKQGTPVVLVHPVPKGAQVGLSLEREGGRSDHPTTIIGVSQPL